jgi:hypothetical protein
LSALPPAGQTAQHPLPNSAMKDPDGQKVQFKFHTLPGSVQIYTCRQTDQAFVWAGPDPDAILMNDEKTLTVHHYQGPTSARLCPVRAGGGAPDLGGDRWQRRAERWEFGKAFFAERQRSGPLVGITSASFGQTVCDGQSDS